MRHVEEVVDVEHPLVANGTNVRLSQIKTESGVENMWEVEEESPILGILRGHR